MGSSYQLHQTCDHGGGFSRSSGLPHSETMPKCESKNRDGVCTYSTDGGGRWHVAGGKELIWKSPTVRCRHVMEWETSMVMMIRVKEKRIEERVKDRSIDGSNIEWKPLRLLFAGYSRT